MTFHIPAAALKFVHAKQSCCHLPIHNVGLMSPEHVQHCYLPRIELHTSVLQIGDCEESDRLTNIQWDSLTYCNKYYKCSHLGFYLLFVNTARVTKLKTWLLNCHDKLSKDCNSSFHQNFQPSCRYLHNETKYRYSHLVLNSNVSIISM